MNRKWILVPLFSLFIAALVLLFSHGSRLALLNYTLQLSLGAAAPEISEWQGFVLKEKHFSIGKLVVFLPENAKPLIVEDVVGEYRFRPLRLENISVGKISLSLNKGENSPEDTNSSNQLLMLSELLAMGVVPPLPRGELRHIQLDDLDDPLSLRWKSSALNSQQSTLWQASFQDFSLSTEISRINQFEYSVNVEVEGNRIQLNLLSGKGQKNWEAEFSLQAFNFDLLRGLYPEDLVFTSGWDINPELQVQATIPESLNGLDPSSLNANGALKITAASDRYQLPDEGEVLNDMSLGLDAHFTKKGEVLMVNDARIHLKARHQTYWMPSLNLSMDMQVSKEKILIGGRLLDVREREFGSIDGVYHFTNNSLDLNLNSVANTFNADDGALSTWFSRWPFPGDVLKGELAWKAAVAWDDTAGLKSANIAMSFDEISGFVDDIIIKDLQSQLYVELREDGDWLLRTDSPLSVGSVDVGLVASTVSTNLQANLTKGEFRGTNLSADLFGGHVEAPSWIYAPAAFPNKNIVHFHSMDVATLVDEAGYEGVEGSGLIAGELPVEIDANGVSVDDGLLRAVRPGGILRYFPSAAAKQAAASNPSLDLVNQALSNYHYHLLNASVDYAKNGDLELSMRMEGKNPDMNGGQEINLNLNVSESIPSLLKSLQASRIVTDALSKELQQ